MCGCTVSVHSGVSNISVTLNMKDCLSPSEDCRACSNYKYIEAHYQKCLKSLKSMVKVKIFSAYESNISIRLEKIASWIFNVSRSMSPS